MPKSFIFQINPREYRVWDALQHVHEHGNIIVLGPHNHTLARGSAAYLWQAQNTGLVARGTVLEEKALRNMPTWQHQFGKHDAGERVVVRIDSVAQRPIRIGEINRNAILRRVPFFKNGGLQGAVFYKGITSRVCSELNKFLRGASSISGEGLSRLARLDEERSVLIRKEQRWLRQHILNGKDHGTCFLCGEELPAELLIASHIKKRARCSDKEKRDGWNIVPMCVLGCDALFERGHVAIAGKAVDIRLTRHKSPRLHDILTALKTHKVQVEIQRKKYFDWHAKHAR